MNPGENGAEGEPFGGASTPWPPPCPHPLLFSSAPGSRAQLHPPERSPHRPFSAKQHDSPPPSPAPAPAGSGATPSPPPGYAYPGARSAFPLPADTPAPAPAPDSSVAPRECGSRSNHWLCGPAWALPLPLPKGQEGQDGARGVSRVNRLGAAGV